MKSEVKLDFTNKEVLENFIRRSYIDCSSDIKKISNNQIYLKLTPDVDIDLYNSILDLNNVTAKILNPDLIDGFLRTIIIQSDGEVKMYPISIHCIIEDGRYSFY